MMLIVPYIQSCPVAISKDHFLIPLRVDCLLEEQYGDPKGRPLPFMVLSIVDTLPRLGSASTPARERCRVTEWFAYRSLF
jgi:hypothetical protein